MASTWGITAQQALTVALQLRSIARDPSNFPGNRELGLVVGISRESGDISVQKRLSADANAVGSWELYDFIQKLRDSFIIVAYGHAHPPGSVEGPSSYGIVKGRIAGDIANFVDSAGRSDFWTERTFLVTEHAFYYFCLPDFYSIPWDSMGGPSCP
jgi:hypothetical protein